MATWVSHIIPLANYHFYHPSNPKGNPSRNIWLVVTGTMEVYDFFHSVGNGIIPTDELHDFSEGEVETTNQYR
jgi:hypothetical protein